MKKIKALTAMLTSLTLIAGTMYSITVSAENDSVTRSGRYNELNYDVLGDHIEIAGCTDKAKTLLIPDTIDGLPVTSVSLGAFEETDIEEVIVGNNVTEIGGGAFCGCYKLKAVTLPDSLDKISQNLFYGCSSLKTVTVPDSVDSIGDCAFYFCVSLKEIDLPDSVGSIGKGAFCGCSRLGKLTVRSADCSIPENSDLETVSTRFLDMRSYFEGTIYGHNDSTAKAFADKYNYRFASLDEKSTAVIGDANFDGKVNVRDAAFIALYVSKHNEIKLPQSADYNDDGFVNIRDAAAISRGISNVH